MIKFQNKEEEIDDFLSGRFHFEKNIQHNTINDIKYALTRNDQDALYKALKKIDGANDVLEPKTKQISNDVITIGFFCNYSNSGIIRNTVGIYNQFFNKIRWVICHIGETTFLGGFSCPIITFPDTESAIEYANQNFDFVVDADSFLRPENFYEIIKNTTSYTMNFFNLSCSTYNNYFDVVFVPETIELSKYPPSEQYVVKVPNLGSWHIDAQTKFHPKYLYDIAFIGDQFKYGKNFFKLYKDFSKEFKIVFLGLRDVQYFKQHLIQAEWDLKNIEFFPRIDNEASFRYFLTKTKVVIDTPDYSGGSSNIYALRTGTPVLTLDGKYLVDGMISAVLKEIGLDELCFENVNQMKQFISSKNTLEFKKYRKYIIEKTSQSLQFQPKEFLPIFYKRLMEVFKENNRVQD